MSWFARTFSVISVFYLLGGMFYSFTSKILKKEKFGKKPRLVAWLQIDVELGVKYSLWSLLGSVTNFATKFAFRQKLTWWQIIIVGLIEVIELFSMSFSVELGRLWPEEVAYLRCGFAERVIDVKFWFFKILKSSFKCIPCSCRIVDTFQTK